MFFRRVPLAGFAVILLAAGTIHAQPVISMVGGNGQLTQQQFNAVEPLTVLVKDVLTGQPLANQAVNWSISPLNQGTLFDTQTFTDANGLTSTRFSGQGVFYIIFTSFVQSTVTASLSNGGSVNFTETVALVDPKSSAVQVVVSVISGDNGMIGALGSTGATPLLISVRSNQTQQGVPNVSLKLTGTNPAEGPSVACAGGSPPGTVYTGADGVATCTPIFSGRAGTGITHAVVGGGFTTYDIGFTITGSQQLPAIQKIQGDNQTGSPGTTLPLPLIARVTDGAGRPLAAIPVAFEATVAGSATISNVRSPSDADGRVQATVTLGQVTGPVQVRVRTTDGSNLSAAFNLSSVPAFASLVKVSGDVQQANVNGQFTLPLVVRVNDSQGRPVANVPVQFAMVSGPVVLGTPFSSTVTVNTDASGQARLTLRSPGSAGAIVISATAGTLSQTFNLTAGTGGPVTFTAMAKVSGDTQDAVLNSAFAQPVVVRVTDSQGQAVANVPVQFVVTSGGALLGAPPSSVVTVNTDALGLARANVQAGGALGPVVITATAGTMSQTFSLNVKAAAPAIASVLKISGEPQDALLNTTFSQPLVIQVSDEQGRGIPNVPVQFTAISGIALVGSPPAIVATVSTDASGQARVTVQAGGTVGVVVVAATAGSFTQTFSLNVRATAPLFSALVKLSGEPQDAGVNSAFAQPLIVQVTDSQGRPVPNIPVQFIVSSGAALLGSPPALLVTANTDALGQARVSVQAGSVTGPVVIAATAGSFSQMFSLNIREGPPPGPSVTADSFNNVSPCGIATLTAPGLASGIQGVMSGPEAILSGPLPERIANVSLRFGSDFYAPILSVSNTGGQESVTFQTPCSTQPGWVPVTVYAANTTVTVDVQVQAYSPGILQTTMSDGNKRAVLTHLNGSFVTLQNPAAPGETIRLYATGLGQTTPPTDTNTESAIADQVVVAPVIVGVDNAGVEVLSAKLARGRIGVYEVAFRVPPDAATGDNVPLGLAVTPTDGGPAAFAIASAIPIR